MTTATASLTRLTPITAKATAVLARRELKAAYPGIKFSVRANGHRFDRLSITWENGPTKSSVEATLAKFIGVKQNFNYVADMWGIPAYVDNGAGSYYGVSAIDLSRAVSNENVAAVELEAMNALGVSTMTAVMEIWEKSRRQDGSQQVMAVCSTFGVLNGFSTNSYDYFDAFVSNVLSLRTLNA